MYVTRGMAAVPRTHRRIPLPPRPFLVRRRGVGADGSDANSCTSPNYWNGAKGICCAPPGTPAAGDPCSILNDPGYLAAQAADVGPLGPNGVPLSSPNFAAYPTSPTNLADIAGYPNNVQQDVQTCYTNPGASFVDSVGMQVNCPAGKTQIAPGNPGIWVSTNNYAQLASMLAPSLTPKTALLGNSPFAQPTEPYPATPQLAAGNPLSVRLVNASGGSNSSFNVGDSWQIIVTGTPNAPVQASASQNGASLGTTPMGVIAANGQLVLQGSFSASQVGQWVENWTVGGKAAGSVSFSVAAPSGGSGGGGGGGNTGGGNGNTGGNNTGGSNNSNSTANPFAFLTNTVSLFGVSIPVWALGGGALLAVFMFGGRRG